MIILSIRTYVSAGLPNITGRINFVADVHSDETTGRNTIVSSSVETKSGKYCAVTSDVGRFFAVSKTIDASLSNSIYGSSTTVTPKSYTTVFLIKY